MTVGGRYLARRQSNQLDDRLKMESIAHLSFSACEAIDCAD
jgi:hypothetical protein